MRVRTEIEEEQEGIKAEFMKIQCFKIRSKLEMMMKTEVCSRGKAGGGGLIPSNEWLFCSKRC
jgi:hypothetical protein